MKYYSIWRDMTFTGSIFHFARPDASFAQDSPSVIIFPRHSAQAWARGERKTAPKAQYVNKARGLRQKQVGFVLTVGFV